MRSLTICLTMLFFVTGCTSFGTTIAQRCSNGTLIPNIPKAKTRGVPVKLKVPSHVVVNVKETYFVQKAEGNGIPKEIKLIDTYGQQIRSLDLTTRVEYDDKVFTVDFKRPAGGILDITSITYDQEQYFKDVQATYTENTLKDINTAIGNVKTAIKSSASIPATQDKLAHETRQVATGRFDISVPGWEEELQCFVEQHITSCTGTCVAQNQTFFHE